MNTNENKQAQSARKKTKFEKWLITIVGRITYYIVGAFVYLVAGALWGIKIKKDPEIKEWHKAKIPFVVLCQHPSEFDAVLMLMATFPSKIRFVAGAQQLYLGVKGKFLTLLNVIPKRQFVADINAIKEMLKTIKSGQVLGFMPEGRVSIDGTTGKVEPSTASLLKQLGVPVAMLSPHGDFFVKPSYNSPLLLRGKVSADYTVLFTQDEIKSMSAEELQKRLDEAFVYNDIEYVRGSKRTYGKKNHTYLQYVSHLLYLCPDCGKLYTIKEEAGKVYCDACGSSANTTHEMFFKSVSGNFPDMVDKWNAIQYDFEKTYWGKDNAKLEFKVARESLLLGRDTEFALNGEGTLTLDKEKFVYIQNGNEEDKNLTVELRNISGMSADYRTGRINYYNGLEVNHFLFEKKQDAARFSNALFVIKGWK